jgi:hypothetical protein
MIVLSKGYELQPYHEYGFWPGSFFARKEKRRLFLIEKIFAGPGDPDFFCKNRNCWEIHDETK